MVIYVATEEDTPERNARLTILGLSIGILLWTLFKLSSHGDFLVAIVVAARTISSSHFGIYVLTGCVVAAQLIWQLVWFALFSMAVQGASVAFFLHAVFTFIWVEEAISSAVHVAIADSVASWFFQEQLSLPTVRAAGRALVFSFGTVALSSLALAIIRFLEWLLDSFSSHSESLVMRTLTCIIRVMLWCVEKAARFFNYYALTISAIYGGSFLDSAKKAKRLLENRETTGELLDIFFFNFL